jgi:hypothetical protein
MSDVAIFAAVVALGFVVIVAIGVLAVVLADKF